MRKEAQADKNIIFGQLWHIISHDKDEDSLFSHALEVLADLLGKMEAAVFVWEPVEKVLRARKVLRDNILQDGEEVIVVVKGSPLWGLIRGITDLVADKRAQASICVALRDEEELYGMLRITRLGGGRFSQKDFSRIRLFCSELTVAVKNLKNFMQNERHVRQLKASFEISSNIVKSLRLEELLRLIVKSIVNHMGFDRVRLYRVDHSRQVLSGEVCYDLRGRITPLEHEQYPLTQHKHPLVEQLYEKGEHFDKQYFNDIVIFVPLKVKGVVEGLLVIDNILSRQRITSEERQTIQSFAGQIAMAVSNSRLFEKIEELSITDSLTGLYVPRHFKERLKEEMYRSKRYGAGLGLFIIDIDDFKKINDTFGHPGGDRVLQTVSGNIKEILRRTDFACRYGGDEFMVCLLNVELKDIVQLGERLLKTVQKSCEFLKRKNLSVGISVGMVLSIEGSDDTDDIMKKADDALYEAKKRGKNQICGWWEIS